MGNWKVIAACLAILSGLVTVSAQSSSQIVPTPTPAPTLTPAYPTITPTYYEL